jgi:YbbR domain-containing protein
VPARSGSLRDWFVRNLGFKIVALVVAVVVWFGVKTDRQTEVRYPVPLEIRAGADDETVVGRVPETVNVVFSGTGRDLLRLSEGNYRVSKRLDPGPPGPRRVTLDASDVTGSGSAQVRAVSVEPQILTVNTDRVVSKRVPLRAQGEVEPASGFALAGPVKFDPPTVTLIGARSLLAEIDTLAVDLSGFRGSREPIRKAVSLSLPKYPSVVIQPDSIRVVVGVEEAGRAAERRQAGRS